MTFGAEICQHAGECARGLPSVSDVSQRPWIQPGNASPEEVAAQVRRCPSGALQYVLSDEPAPPAAG